MPFYEYECGSCKFYTEVMQKITDAPLTKCPACGKKTLKKLVSAPVFRLKGAGWYETDFKSDKEAKRNIAQAEKAEPKESGAAAGEGKAAEKSVEKPADSKADAKPAAAESKAPPQSTTKTAALPPKPTAPARSTKSKAKARRAGKARR